MPADHPTPELPGRSDDQEAADKLRYPVRLNDVAMQALSMLDNATVRLLVSRRRLLLHLWMP